MAAVTITLTGVCSGGGHADFAVTGDISRDIHVELFEINEPVSLEDVQAFLKVITKLAKMGRTNAQAKAVMQAGINITV